MVVVLLRMKNLVKDSRICADIIYVQPQQNIFTRIESHNIHQNLSLQETPYWYPGKYLTDDIRAKNKQKKIEEEERKQALEVVEADGATPEERDPLHSAESKYERNFPIDGHLQVSTRDHHLQARL